MRVEVVLYGDTGMLRALCPDCEDPAFILEGAFQCCGRWVGSVEPKRLYRESETTKRKPPEKAMREKVLRSQKFRCFYCLHPFGTVIRFSDGHAASTRIFFDKKVPFAFDDNSHPHNIVAVCQICNGIKSALPFNSIHHLRDYMTTQWRANRYAVLGKGETLSGRAGTGQAGRRAEHAKG